MKKLLAVTGAILAVYILASAAQYPRHAGNVQDAPESGAPYTVREYRGYVAVFEAGDKPQITDTAVASLPRSDRSKLERGIEIYSEEELKTLLEDLCS